MEVDLPGLLQLRVQVQARVAAVHRAATRVDIIDIVDIYYGYFRYYRYFYGYCRYYGYLLGILLILQIFIMDIENIVDIY